MVQDAGKEAESSQLDDIDPDEHATDMVLNMLEETMLGGGARQQQQPSAMKARQQPPEQPPPMPALSSAVAVLESEGQSTARFSDQPTHEPPSQPEVPQASLDTAAPQQQPVAQWEVVTPTRVLQQQEMLQVPTGQTEMTAMPFSTACAVAICILGAARLGQNEEHIEARGDGRALHLLSQRQQENFAANQPLPGEGTTSEQRIQEARLKVCIATCSQCMLCVYLKLPASEYPFFLMVISCRQHSRRRRRQHDRRSMLLWQLRKLHGTTCCERKLDRSTRRLKLDVQRSWRGVLKWSVSCCGSVEKKCMLLRKLPKLPETCVAHALHQ